MKPLFAPGDRVVVRDADVPGHIRTPFFIRGKSGKVVDVFGAYPHPEEVAYGRDGLPPTTLYKVRFVQREVWPDYSGPAHDTVSIEIFENWLTPVR